MKIFEKFTRKVIKEKIAETVEDNWDTVVNVFGVLVGFGLIFGSRKDDKKNDSARSITINNTYNYYDNRRFRRK